jgi:hypothetical protein
MSNQKNMNDILRYLDKKREQQGAPEVKVREHLVYSANPDQSKFTYQEYVLHRAWVQTKEGRAAMHEAEQWASLAKQAADEVRPKPTEFGLKAKQLDERQSYIDTLRRRGENVGMRQDMLDQQRKQLNKAVVDDADKRAFIGSEVYKSTVKTVKEYLAKTVEAGEALGVDANTVATDRAIMQAQLDVFLEHRDPNVLFEQASKVQFKYLQAQHRREGELKHEAERLALEAANAKVNAAQHIATFGSSAAGAE